MDFRAVAAAMKEIVIRLIPVILSVVEVPTRKFIAASNLLSVV